MLNIDSSPRSPNGNKRVAKGWNVTIPLDRLDEALIELGGTLFKLQFMLETYARSSNVCWPAASTLAKRMGLDPRSLRRHMAELVAGGWIRRDVTPKGRQQIILLKRMSLVGSTADHGIIRVGGGGQKCPGGEDKNVPQNKNEVNKGIEAEDHGVEIHGGGSDSSRQSQVDALRRVKSRIAGNRLAALG